MCPHPDPTGCEPSPQAPQGHSPTLLRAVLSERHARPDDRSADWHAMRFHEEQHGVYFDDLDPFRILHNARYLLIMERTIGSFWHHLGWRPIGDGNHDPDQDHLVRAQDISYEVPVQGTGRVRCRIWVEHLGRTSLQFGFQILPMDEDTPHCRGHRTLVRIDADTREAVPWSDEFRVRIRPYRRDTDPPAA